MVPLEMTMAEAAFYVLIEFPIAPDATQLTMQAALLSAPCVVLTPI
jgi:hypothetical protein